MAYIGVQPTDTYLSIASQQITGTGSATYTLDYSVSNEEDVAVFVNNVRQNVSSYTVSGDQLTLGGTISASDECWVLFLGRTVGTKTPAVGSVTNDMLAGSIANAKLANSSITLNGSAVSLGGSATVGGTNTPAFHGYRTSSQTINTGTWTKIQIDVELFDSDNNYDATTNYRFTPTTAGKYYIYGSVNNGVYNLAQYVAIYKNGSQELLAQANSDGGSIVNVSGIVDFNGSTDYVELYTYITTSSTSTQGQARTFFGGYKIII